MTKNKKEDEDFERRIRNTPGQYVPIKVEKGVNETALDLEEGDIYWEVCLEPGAHFDVETQFEAEVMVRLVRMQKILNSITKLLKEVKDDKNKPNTIKP